MKSIRHAIVLLAIGLSSQPTVPPRRALARLSSRFVPRWKPKRSKAI